MNETESAIEQELSRLQREADRLTLATTNFITARVFLEHVNKDVHQIGSLYSSGYQSRIDVHLSAITVDSFNFGKLAFRLADIAERIEVDLGQITSKDDPQAKCRTFSFTKQLDEIGLNFTLSVYLAEDSMCQVVIDGYDTIETEHFVKVTEQKPRMRFVCPEE